MLGNQTVWQLLKILLPVLPLLKQLGPYQPFLDSLHLNSMLFICKINIYLSVSWIFLGHLSPDKRKICDTESHIFICCITQFVLSELYIILVFDYQMNDLSFIFFISPFFYLIHTVCLALHFNAPL